MKRGKEIRPVVFNEANSMVGQGAGKVFCRREEGMIITKWKVPFLQRLRLLFSGSLFILTDRMPGIAITTAVTFGDSEIENDSEEVTEELWRAAKESSEEEKNQKPSEPSQDFSKLKENKKPSEQENESFQKEENKKLEEKPRETPVTGGEKKTDLKKKRKPEKEKGTGVDFRNDYFDNKEKYI